ncbi:zinc finger protein 112-like isoform X2 [Nymphalis io]|uniref:zinc finger protein 112-like isoform X2 n=1 Tax=Inachis io TaxID=171585 RepID=UPI002169054C|nr:zinc finger protein 112-like isoform X2 [Nymphalis io]
MEYHLKINENLCRLCLKEHNRMLCINNTYLQDVYEKITNIELNSITYIQSLCFICVKRLKNCHTLIEQAIATDKRLKDALQCNSGIDQIEQRETYKLCISSTINISLDPVDCDVKKENAIKEELHDKEDGNDIHNISHELDQEQDDINTETNIKDQFLFDDVKSDLDVKETISDSEDDIPLKNISLKQHLDRKLEDSVKIKKYKKYNKETKVDAQELILDEEQQVIEMLQRSKSLNYLNSPYKCDLCYKGFLDPIAFDKHKEKHDEISGPHECKLCHLRYLTVKSLRAHTTSAHSRRFSCNICSHRSHTKHQAKAHEQWHKGHTYPCKPCGRAFSKPTSYLSHVRKWHAGGAEHVCADCGESFARRHGLLMHRSKAHRAHAHKPKPEPDADGFCVECNIQFASSEARTRHVLISKRHAIFKDNDPRCALCGAKVPPAARAAHARRHVRALGPPAPAPRPPLALACEQCDSTFPSRAKLQNHVKRIHLGLKYNKNIVCEICGKKCTVHTGAKPYECHVCNKPFSQSNSLKTHIRTVHLRLPPNKKKKDQTAAQADEKDENGVVL